MQRQHATQLFTLLNADRENFEQWLRWLTRIRTDDEARALVVRFPEKFAADNCFMAGIWREAELLGVILLRYVDRETSTTEIEYFLASNARGNGIATRSCEAMVDYAFDEMGLQNVLIKCAMSNERSAMVPQRLGFSMKRTEEPAYADVEGNELLRVFAMNRERWRT